MIAISVSPGPGGSLEVRLHGDGHDTTHTVTVPSGLARSVGCAGADPTELVRASFAFLLQREPPTSILRRFSLDQITSYFPEYPSAVADLVEG